MTAAEGDQRAGGEPDSPPAAEFIDISKRFRQVVACDRVNLALHYGRIHGVLGENGAGKSTLMKMLIGLVLPTRARSVCTGRGSRSPIQSRPPDLASGWCISTSAWSSR